MLAWAEKHRDQYLNAQLETEGRGRIFLKKECCSQCKQTKAEYRCMDCFGLRMLCKACILHHHHDEPLHFVQVCSFQYIHVDLVNPSVEVEWVLLKEGRAEGTWNISTAGPPSWRAVSIALFCSWICSIGLEWNPHCSRQFLWMRRITRHR